MSTLMLRPDCTILSRRMAATCGRHTPFVSCSALGSHTKRAQVTRPSAGPARGLRRLGRGVVRVLAYASDISDDSYVCVGLAQCFRKVEGGLQAVLVMEPLSASSLECLANGARTSYKHVTALSFGDAIQRRREALPELFRAAPFCDNYEFRCEAAARTWLRAHAQDNLMDIVPLGKVRGDFNFSLEDKRILNVENVVNDADNVKQDMSIDVYGRKKADDGKAKKAGESVAQAAEDVRAAKKQQEEDDLDALLLA